MGLALIAAGACSGDQTGSAAPASPSPSSNATVVTRVVDGDTIIVASGNNTVRVRLIGVNTPETVDPRRPVECFGKEASARTKQLLAPGTAVRLERDAEPLDRYGRTLAYVYRASDNLFVNLRLVADGFGQTMTIPPNVTFADRFRAAERAARSEGRGLWSKCRGN